MSDDDETPSGPPEGVCEPANTGREPDGRFAPGNRVNPAGKPPGARHRTTLAIEALLEGEAEKFTRKAVELALNGDTTALRLCLERLAPPAKSRRVAMEMPPIQRAEDLPAALAAVTSAMAEGELAVDEASSSAQRF